MTIEVNNSIRTRNRSYKRFKRTKQANRYEMWKVNARETNYQMHKAKLEHVEKVKKQLLDISAGETTYWKLKKSMAAKRH
jgi:hypothetical protein